MKYPSGGNQLQTFAKYMNTPILPHQLVNVCFDQLAGTIRPAWELGPQRGSALNCTKGDTTLKIFERSAIAIHCHVYYPELLYELAISWRVVKNRYIFITTNTQLKADIIRNLLARCGEESYLIKIVPNRGRDIAPLLSLLKHELSGYKIVIHCHTKKTSQENVIFGSSWRNSLLKATFPEDSIAEQFERLLSGQNAGLIMPWPHYAIAHNVNWGANFKRVHCILNLLGYDIYRYTFLYFPAGSFFWARVDSLVELLRLNLRAEDFCNEPTPGDGSVAHAIERCFGLIPMLQNRNCYAYWTGDCADGFLEAPKQQQLVELPPLLEVYKHSKTWFEYGMQKAVELSLPRQRSVIIRRFACKNGE